MSIHSQGIILDCSKYQTAIDSLSAVFDTQTGALIRFLKKYSYPGIYEEPEDVAEDIMEKACSNFRSFTWPTRVKWFHMTCISPNENLESGLLPTKKVAERIIFPKLIRENQHRPRVVDNINKIRTNPGEMLSYKFDEAGPHAVLVREHVTDKEFIFASEGFLYSSELIQDIEMEYKREFGQSLKTNINNQCVATIVHFQVSVSGFEGRKYTRDALNYVYQRLNHLDFDANGHNTYSAKGKTIDRTKIVNIERYVNHVGHQRYWWTLKKTLRELPTKFRRRRTVSINISGIDIV